MQPQYLNFPCEDFKVHDGKVIHLIIIPADNEWGKPMGITDKTAYVCVGYPVHDKHPPNTMIIRQEMLDLKDGLNRAMEVFCFLYLRMKKNKDNLYIVETNGGDYYCDFIKHYEEIPMGDHKGKAAG